ncbi:hypothetical protein QFZ79_003129 [Arthrobacter sp. V4I6]|uniref:helicase associated domain-containing protein n=1 Tax=unclassified Arthrobacter TaxID=235627 RepID=UPI00277E1B7B|nr:MULTISPECIES: helicase associated domain-containing protein [unclassified Arthrobacter]MDQ0820756.1 hypothetical protein [Arthrobacter sp. V1I7]MDQ0855018.1 hypothetical protein [Arthrobacter sp. V4I6]
MASAPPGRRRAGRLAPAVREGLAVPDWEGKPRVQADEQRWWERLAALKAYLAAGNDWPRHKVTVTGEEHELGVWLHGQRIKQRRSQLDPYKTAALDATVPGWRVGRKRGRRPAAAAWPGRPTAAAELFRHGMGKFFSAGRCSIR